LGNIEVLAAIMAYSNTRFTPELLRPLVQCLCGIEPNFFALAAVNATQEQLDAMAGILAEVKKSRNVDRISELIFEFVHAASLASGNIVYPLLSRTLKPIYNCFTNVKDFDYLDEIIEMLELIMHALQERDAVLAEQLSNTNINRVATWLEENFAPGEAFDKA
jgi:DNA-binding FadR family transcriptional regulator